MGDALFQRSFGGGELAPVLHARADTAKYATGAKTIKNFLVRREGGVTTRPGWRYTATAKTPDFGTKLARFVSTVANQSVLIEMGSGYFRFYREGGAVNVSGVAAWSAVTAYEIGDLVVDTGINYYCVQANTNQEPPDASFWHPLVGTIYEIPTPYSLANIPQWNQSGNVITLTNPNLAPMELVYVSLTRWILRAVSTSNTSQPPTTPLATGGNPIPAWDAAVAYQVGAIVTSGGDAYTCILNNTNQVPPNATYWLLADPANLTRSYVITAREPDTLEESIASAQVDVVSFLPPIATAPNALTWTAPVGGADSYAVYCDPYGNGIFGFIGDATTNAFKDPGFTPDFDTSPPVQRTLFVNPNGFPSVSANWQQRRFFANTFDEPDAVYGSRTGFASNFGVSTPLQDDDAITLRLAGNNHHPVRHMVAVKAGLVLLTDGGEWTLTGGGGPGTAVTPNSLLADQETYVGCDADVRPVVVGGSIIYLQTRGSIVRELEFAQQVQGLAGKDMTVFATHLFEGHAIVAADYQQVPDSIIWVVRDDGVLLGLTYVPEQDLWGWHRHETWQNGEMGLIEDVCIIPEAEEDGVYVIVKRMIGGDAVRYIERLDSRVIVTFNEDAFYVDAGLSYHGSPQTVFSDLDHLEGQVVAVVADGLVVYNGDPAGTSAAAYTVSAGAITIPTAARDVHIGLAIRYSDLETLSIDAQGSNVRDKRKAIHGVKVLVEASSRTFFAGPDATRLRKFDRQKWQSADKQATGAFEVLIPTTWSDEGNVLIRQKDPLPLTIIGIMPNVDVGG